MATLITMFGSIYKRITWAGIALIAILAVGSLGYWLIGGRENSFLDVLYMTFITITTIGFNEVVDMTANPGGRAFTMVIAVSGIGVIAYIATNVTALLIEGELTKSFRSRKMEKKAGSLENHYIICGFGRIGRHIVEELDSTGRSYVVIEKDENHVEKLLDAHKDSIAIRGDATDDSVLIAGGIRTAKGIFAVAGDDNQNLVISLTAKQLNPKIKVVARCNETGNAQKIHKAGADNVIAPDEIGGMRMASEMIRPTVVSFLDIMLRDREMNLRVEEMVVPDSFAGSTIKALGLKDHPSILPLAVRDGEQWVYNPPGDYLIKPKHTLIYMGSEKARHDLEKIFHANT
jgi:voltage-gated potassium channel